MLREYGIAAFNSPQGRILDVLGEQDASSFRSCLTKAVWMNPSDIRVSNLFASVWSLIQTVLLAATAEDLRCALRIPIPDEASHVMKTIHASGGSCLPCCLAEGYTVPDATVVRPQGIPF